MTKKVNLEEEVLDSSDVDIIRSEIEDALLTTRPSRIQKRTSIEVDLTKAVMIDGEFYESLYAVCTDIYSSSAHLAAETITLVFSRHSDAWKEYRKRKSAVQYFTSKAV